MKLHVLFTFLISLSLSPSLFAQVWMIQNTDVSNHLQCIKAVDENTVWAAGWCGTFLRTTDGGQNWRSGQIPGTDLIDIYSIAPIDSNIIYVSASGFLSPDTRIYKTTDGGQNWELQYQNIEASAFINSIAFWDEMNGIAVSDTVGNTFVILRTTDGGANWDQVPMENIPAPLANEYAGFGDGGGTSLTLRGNNVWFGTGYTQINSEDSVRIFKSTDKGQTWEAYRTPFSTEEQTRGISTITFQDSLIGFAGGSLGLLKTVDGGKSWSTVSSYNNELTTLVYVPGTNDQVLIAATFNETLYSNDNGENWSILDTENFIAISFASPEAGWAVGGNGKIAKYNGLPLITATEEQENKQSHSPTLYNNYPDPFTNTTTIRFYLPSTQHVNVKVFDSYGKEIAIIVNESLPQGDHKLQFDGSGMSSGYYLYQVHSGGQLQVGKMILIR